MCTHDRHHVSITDLMALSQEERAHVLESLAEDRHRQHVVAEILQRQFEEEEASLMTELDPTICAECGDVIEPQGDSCPYCDEPLCVDCYDLHIQECFSREEAKEDARAQAYHRWARQESDHYQRYNSGIF